MYKRVSPGIIRLWVVYQENGVNQEGLTDIKIEIKYANGTSIVSETSMAESPAGFYLYDWNTDGVGLDQLILVYYKKGMETLDIEEIIVDILEDQDATAM